MVGHGAAGDTGGWKKIALPLSRIGADQKRIDGRWVQNATDEAVAPFDVTGIALRRTPPPLQPTAETLYRGR